MKRMEDKGYKPADIARLLHVSKASVSKTLSGKQNPRPGTLQAFRRIVEDHCGEHPRDTTLRKNDVNEQLQFLKEHAPQSFAAVKATINALVDSAVNASPKKEEASRVAAAATALVDTAKKLAQESLRKRPTPAPSARKSSRGDGVPPERK